MSVDGTGIYEVRQSRIRTGLVLALYSLLPVTAMVIGLWDLANLYMFFIFGLVFEAIHLTMTRRRVVSAVRRELLFAIDEQGVYLGPDEYGRPAMREPWSRVDSVVHFEGRVWTTSNRPTAIRNVGIVQGGRIVTSRGMRGWRLNVKRAAAAAARFGGGTPVLKAPYCDQVPREYFHHIPLPPEWRAAHARPLDGRLPPEASGTTH